MKPLKDMIEPKRITVDIPSTKVEEDLEKFRQMAVDLGAAEAAVISPDDIIVDERVRAKCIYPKCMY